MEASERPALSRLADLAAKGLLQVKGSKAPLYLYPEAPFWFVPSSKAHVLLDAVLRKASDGPIEAALPGSSGNPINPSNHRIEALIRSITPPRLPPHRGRKHLPLERITELWLHLTDACNLACTHCLFACKPGQVQGLPNDLAMRAVGEALPLGCSLVCLTGGEPLVHPDFMDLMRRLQDHAGLQVAVLTNATLIPMILDRLRQADPSRMHFQVSLDGPEEVHDAVRGPGCYRKVAEAVEHLLQAGIPCSTVMAVHGANHGAMPGFIRASHAMGVRTVHFLWHFPRGSGKDMGIPPMDSLIACFKEAAREARSLGVTIDNLEAIRAQIFTCPGTRFDLGSAGWTSLTVGPDGSVYPSPALVGLETLRCGHLSDGLENVWRNSPRLKQLRELSLLDLPWTAADPWRFLLGGGDIDHCCHHPEKMDASGLLGPDPYLPLYQAMALMLIEEEADALHPADGPGLVLRMGDITTECPSGADVNFTHTNCLLSVGDVGTRTLVREFYASKARQPDGTILNPVHYPPQEVEFIPKEGLFQMYGCGSPVSDARIQPGEVVVDLGCGSGVECFMAARAAGPEGRAIGIDMTDEMLEIAERSRGPVAEALGYANTEFRKGFLERLPLEDASADVVISNCVINLCNNKRCVFQEIRRILKPGGRLVISDVVCEADPPLTVKADHQLTGECISGAMVQDYLFAMLEETGFEGARVLKRFPYRVVQGHPFFSLTFTAYRPSKKRTRELLYGGPFQSIELEDGQVLERGVRAPVKIGAGIDMEALAGMGVYVLHPETGAVENADIGFSTCCCAAPGDPAASIEAQSRGDEEESASCCRPSPAPPIEPRPTPKASPEVDQHGAGCLICGAPLRYLNTPETQACEKCGKLFSSSALCEEGHYICDLCHLQDPVEFIRTVCRTTRETDMIRLMAEIRAHPLFSRHGPEHHSMVPAVIVATYRNLGGRVDDLQLAAAIDRGGLAPGGACGFMGCCGAATGVGVAFAILLGSNPLLPGPRKISMRVTSRVLEKIAVQEAARCCQRESYLALKSAAELSREYLSIRLEAEGELDCDQHEDNRDCVGPSCPLFPGA